MVELRLLTRVHFLTTLFLLTFGGQSFAETIAYIRLSSGQESTKLYALPSFSTIEPSAPSILNGAKIAILNQGNDWVQLKTKNNRVGWLPQKDISFLKKGECALIVASRNTMAEANDYIAHNVENTQFLRVFEAANGKLAISIGELTPENDEAILKSWKAKKKIPQDSFCTYDHQRLIRTLPWEAPEKNARRFQRPYDEHIVRHTSAPQKPRRKRGNKELITLANYVAWDKEIRASTYPESLAPYVVKSASYLEKILIQHTDEPYPFVVPIGVFHDSEPIYWSMQFTLKPYKKFYQFGRLCKAYVLQSKLDMPGRKGNNGYWCILDNGLLVIEFLAYDSTMINHIYIAATSDQSQYDLNAVNFYALDGKLVLMSQNTFLEYAKIEDAKRAAKRAAAQSSPDLDDLWYEITWFFSDVKQAADAAIDSAVHSFEQTFLDDQTGERINDLLIKAAIGFAYNQVTKPKLSSADLQLLEGIEKNKDAVLSKLQHTINLLMAEQSQFQEATQSYKTLSEALGNISMSCVTGLPEALNSAAEVSETLSGLYGEKIHQTKSLIAAVNELKLSAASSSVLSAIDTQNAKSQIDASNKAKARLSTIDEEYHGILLFQTSRLVLEHKELLQKHHDTIVEMHQKCLQ